jgi:hypothetical protein
MDTETTYSVQLYIDYAATGNKKQVDENLEAAEHLLKKRLHLWSPYSVDNGEAWVKKTQQYIQPCSGIYPNYLAPSNPGPGIKRLMISFKLRDFEILKNLTMLDEFGLPDIDSVDEKGHYFLGGYISKSKPAPIIQAINIPAASCGVFMTI